MSSSSCSGVMSKQIIKAGDPVVCFLLIRSKMSEYYLNKGCSTFRSNEGEKIIYKPISFPIFGKASYFGKMVDVEKTTHIIDAEKNLGMSIDEFINNIGDFEKNNKLNNISLCYEHRYIYESMIEYAKEKENSLKNLKNINFFPVVLECFGFILCGENYNERYCLHYKHPKHPEYIVKSDGLFIEILLNNKPHPQILNFISFLKFFKLSLKDLSKKNNLSFLNEQAREYYNLFKENNYFMENPTIKNLDLITELIEKKSNKTITKKDTDKLNKLLEELRNYPKSVNENKIKEIYGNDFLKRMESIVKEVSGYISSNFYGKEIFKYDDKLILSTQYFAQAMYKTNSIWMPTYSCYDECGDKSFSEKLLTITKAVD